jgi:gliding motility-associated-like protein
MQPELQGYEVFVSIENGPFQQLGTTLPGQTTYTHEGIEPGRHYAYYVRAFNGNDYGSSSCIRSVYAYSYARPSFNYLANVSVEQNQYVSVKVLADTLATIQGVTIYRKDDENFEELDYITSFNGELFYYEDLTANFRQNSYPYQVSVVDSCGNEILFSNILPTILLQGQFQNQGEVYLEWTAFAGWDGGTEAYEVYRVNEGVIETTPIASLPPSQTQYLDDISPAPTTASSFDYVVAAVEAGNNSFGLSEVSYSNILQLEGSPRIFLPNAFRPTGLNRVFRPVGNYIDQTNYLFQVFDRWGRLVFETSNFNEGWDGSYNGRAMPSGVYVYLLNYQLGDGSLASLKGSFTLIR